MEKNNILFLTYGFPVGGAETMLVNLLNGLDKSKIYPLIVTLNKGSELEKKLKGDFELIRIQRKFRFDLSPAKTISDILVKYDINKVFALDWFSAFFTNLALRRTKKKIKVFISLHSTKPKSLIEFIKNFIYVRFLHGDETLISVCNNQAKYLSSRYCIPLDRFITIYNGVDTNYWKPLQNQQTKDLLREKYGIPKDAFVIIQVARLHKEKRHEDSITALKIIHSRSDKYKPFLIFIGGGDIKRERYLKDLVNKYQLNNYVKFFGVQDDVRQFYWMSDLFTLSSIAIETFSISALEAMACGLPAVITNLGGAREMIIDGFNGYIVPPGSPASLADAWLSVMMNQSRFDMKEITKYVENQFSYFTMYTQYEKILTEGLVEV